MLWPKSAGFVSFYLSISCLVLVAYNLHFALLNINYLGWIISDIKQKGMEYLLNIVKSKTKKTKLSSRSQNISLKLANSHSIKESFVNSHSIQYLQKTVYFYYLNKRIWTTTRTNRKSDLTKASEQVINVSTITVLLINQLNQRHL